MILGHCKTNGDMSKDDTTTTSRSHPHTNRSSGFRLACDPPMQSNPLPCAAPAASLSPRPHVDHTYRDFSRYIQGGGSLPKHKKSGANFPAKLHKILSEPNTSHIITWMPHGRTWKILNKELLVSTVIPAYFGQTKFESFTRQLNGWGFKRLHRPGADFGCYYHQCFLRELPKLTTLMRRAPLNQGKCIPHADGEPHFYLISRSHPLPPLMMSSAQDSSSSSTPVVSQSASIMVPSTSTFNEGTHCGNAPRNHVVNPIQTKVDYPTIPVPACTSMPYLPTYQIVGGGNDAQNPRLPPAQNSLALPETNLTSAAPVAFFSLAQDCSAHVHVPSLSFYQTSNTSNRQDQSLPSAREFSAPSVASSSAAAIDTSAPTSSSSSSLAATMAAFVTPVCYQPSYQMQNDAQIGYHHGQGTHSNHRSSTYPSHSSNDASTSTPISTSTCNNPPHGGGGSNHFSTQTQPQPNYHQQETIATSTEQQLSEHGNHAQPEFPQQLTQGDEHQGSSDDIDNLFDDDFLHFLNFLNDA